MAKKKTALAIDRGGLGLLAKATPVSLPLPERMTFERWQEGGAVLGVIFRACPRWLADWLIWGEDHLGEKFPQALAATGLSEVRAMNLIRVGRAVPPTRRRETLSFDHDEAVATLEPVEQRHWLDKAEKGDNGEPWSSKRLRKELKGGSDDMSDEQKCPTCGKAGYKP